jgi:hypothetical protein
MSVNIKVEDFRFDLVQKCCVQIQVVNVEQVD